jgi:hypothetical protein
MSVAKKYALRTVVFNTTSINQIKGVQISPNIEKYFEYGSGSVDPTFAGIDSEQPIITFSTTAIKKILAAVDVNNGLAITALAKAIFYFQQMAPGSTRLTGSTALKIETSIGIACISGISAADGQAARATVMVYAASTDGETSPLTYTQNVAVPALAATDQLYTIGPAVVNGTAVGAIESFAFDPKIQVRRNRGDGEAYPTFVYIARRGSEQDGPSIKLTTRHLEKAAAGSAVAIASTTTASLRAMSNGGTRTPLATAAHILFTAAAGSVIVEELGADDGDEGKLSLEIAAVGTTGAAFTVASDQALA